ncbi:hypothetical protein COO60DRAFT_1023184 [Scenedesmus sp. NREL 46B-D3]|nr:hypothetical protein COO60DRAFT_1023184 [Scenedesmus sp. NREL 46B-D3]
MDALLLSRQELVSVHFISFLVHRHPELRQAISNWSKQVKSLPRADQQLQLFLEAVPPHILKPVQEEYIQKGKPKAQRPVASGSQGVPAAVAAAAAAAAAVPSAPAGQGDRAMSQHPQQPGMYQQQAQQQAAAAAAQQAALTAQQRGLMPNMPSGAPPRGQQFQGSNNAWANPGQAQLAQQQAQAQARTASPGPGQQAAPAATAGVTQQQLQQILQQQQLAAVVPSNPKIVNLGNGNFTVNGIAHVQFGSHLIAAQTVSQNPQLLAAFMQQQQRAQLAAAAQAGQRPVSAGAAASSAAAAAGKKQGTASPAGALTSQGSAGNLSLSERQAQQQQQRQISAVQLAQLGQQRPPGQAAYPSLQMAGPRPSLYAQPGMAGVRPAAALVPNSAAALLQQHLAGLAPGEAPKIAAPDGYEWVQCASRDGPGAVSWYALPRVSAAVYRGQVAKRKAEEAAAAQPAAKAGPGGVRKKIIDEDVTAGDNRPGLDVLGVDDLQAELALNEAAKGAVVVETGHVQEEHVLSQGPTMNLLARAAKNHGVRAVGEDVYAYLSLATEQHLSQMMRGIVKARLQREDLGKAYKGVEKLDDRLRTGLFQIQKREKEAARKREEEERDELARLGTSRKKLAEEDKKAAKAAQTARQLEMLQKEVGNTLTKMGIGRRNFGAMAALGRPAAAGQPKAGFTKFELQEAKSAAAAAGAVDGTGGAAAAAADGPAVKQEAGAGGDAGAGSSSQAAAAGAAGSVASHVRPVSLQHQLLNESDAPGGGVPAFVAGGGSTGRGADGEEGLRELMLADLIAVLERHPQYCRSQQLYSLYALAGLPTTK